MKTQKVLSQIITINDNIFHCRVAGMKNKGDTVILLHGFPGNERNLDLAQAIRRSGWNAVFFHYRGAWGSGGVFSFEQSDHAFSGQRIALARRLTRWLAERCAIDD